MLDVPLRRQHVCLKALSASIENINTQQSIGDHLDSSKNTSE